MANKPLPGSVQPAPAGLSGFDINHVLTAEQALGFKNAGYAFCVRYLPWTAAADVIAYCQAWYIAVHSAGYVPGIYVGYDTGLTPDQLYNSISFQHYWQAYNGPQETTRGFQILQKTEKTLNGITFDPDITKLDNEGDSALWLAVN
jgi:hypothetical protein